MPYHPSRLVTVAASGKAPSHPRLVCIYKSEWMEVLWNPEDKTYSVGATVPQLDKYDTEGSDVQALVDKELERTSEEDSKSEPESEEELKEPGPLINQQIHLTPIVQSLKASPTNKKPPSPISPRITMMSQTVTQASTAITSTQSALCSTTTSQQLQASLQHILMLQI